MQSWSATPLFSGPARARPPVRPAPAIRRQHHSTVNRPTIRPHSHQLLHSGERLTTGGPTLTRHVVEHAGQVVRRAAAPCRPRRRPRAPAARGWGTGSAARTGRAGSGCRATCYRLASGLRRRSARCAATGSRRRWTGRRPAEAGSRCAGLACRPGPPSGSSNSSPQRMYWPCFAALRGRAGGPVERRVIGVGFARRVLCGSTIAVDAVVAASGRRFRRTSRPAP